MFKHANAQNEKKFKENEAWALKKFKIDTKIKNLKLKLTTFKVFLIFFFWCYSFNLEITKSTTVESAIQIK